VSKIVSSAWDIEKMPVSGMAYFNRGVGAAAAGGVVLDKVVAVPITDGQLETEDMEPGPATVYITGKPSIRTPVFDIVIPAGAADVEVQLWDLIAASVLIPDKTPPQLVIEAVQAYLTANPIEGAGLDQAAVDDRVEAVGDSRYGRVWTASTAYEINAAVILPNGTLGKRTAAGTSRSSFDATELAAWTIAATGLDTAAVAAAISNPETAVNTAVLAVVSTAVPAGLRPVVNMGTNLATPRPAYSGPVLWSMSLTSGIPLYIANGDYIERPSSTPIPWSPSQLPNLFAWFDAANTGGSDGAALPQWNDLSPSGGHHAKQATAGSQPTFRAAGLNAHPAVEFDGTADFLSMDAFTASVGEVWTIYMVGQSTPATLTGGSDFFYGGIGSSGGTGNTATYRTTGSLSSITRGNTLAGPALDNGVHRIRSVFNGNSSSITIDNGTPTVGSTTVAGVEIIKFILGARGDGLNWLAGLLGEVLFVKGTVTTENDAKIAAYLQAKWGVA
jgi:hypothetical protein